jgi:transposase InsO family protein
MERLFLVADVTRQAFHQWLKPSIHQQTRTPKKKVVEMANEIRKKFLPGSSAREVYFYIRNSHETYSSALLGWGKHTFEALCLENGLRIETKRFIPKTTIRGDFVFPNRIEGLIINQINRIWVSDICYLYGANGLLIGYATSLIDLYSRRLLGLSFSQTMHAKVTSCEVLKQALLERKNDTLEGLFFHSDGGKQYIETSFRNTLGDRKIISSMADNCYENAFAESFNDILKNHMLPDLNLNSFHQLKKNEQFIKNCYNLNKRHSGIFKMTPVGFENHILTLQPYQRTDLKIKVVSEKNNLKDEILNLHLS